MRGAYFAQVRRNEWGRIHSWMNRRYDRAIIPWQGTRNFRNKEADGATRHGGPTGDETCIRSASTCTECMSSWMRFAKIPLLWALRTRPSTIFCGATEGDGHTFVITSKIFNVVGFYAKRGTVRSIRVWPYNNQALITILNLLNNL